MKLVVYDVETKNAILGKGIGEIPVPGIQYAQNWGDHAGMGISVICAYVWTEGYRVFLEDNFGEFKELSEDPETLLVGFNNRAFDDQLLKACLGVTLPEHRSWDLLRAVRVARGGSPEYFKGGPNLDSLCKANFLPGKSGSGALAPVLWQQGKIGQVIDYCLNDCQSTVELIELVLAGRLRDHESGRVLPVAKPPSERSEVPA
jgi:hypothetical protein